MADGFFTPLNGFIIITLRLTVFGAHLIGTLGKWLICLSLVFWKTAMSSSQLHTKKVAVDIKTRVPYGKGSFEGVNHD